MTDYPMASLTADIVVMARDFDKRDQPWWYLLIKRKQEPFKDRWALPGGFVNASNDGTGETARQAAYRELREETGISHENHPQLSVLRQIAVRDQPGRDPRGRVISFVFLAVLEMDHNQVDLRAADDAADAAFYRHGSTMSPALAFDHSEIIFGDEVHQALNRYVVWREA